MIKYLGSKRTLVPVIGAVASALGVRSAVDLFAGTTRVGQELRRRGLHVTSNDVTAFSEAFGQAYIAAGPRVDRDRLRRLLAELSRLPPQDGYVTETFCRRSRYFQPENGMRIDAVRAGIDRLDLDPVERGLLLTSLVEAADRVDSTCGVQMAYLKRWAARSANPLVLREPDAVAGPAGAVTGGDANDLAAAARRDRPRLRRSAVQPALLPRQLPRLGDARARRPARALRGGLQAGRLPHPQERLQLAQSGLDGPLRPARAGCATPWVIVSVSDEGFHDPADVERRLAQRGHVGAIPVDFKRYVGAQIGIHNPAGERVGTVSHLRNTEWLFVCGPDRAMVDRAIAAASGNSPRLLAV